MNLLIVDNVVLKTYPTDENSENGFRAAECLEQNRRFIFKYSKEVNDTTWMMRILPSIAKYFNLNRHDVLKWWCAEHGLMAAGFL